MRIYIVMELGTPDGAGWICSAFTTEDAAKADWAIRGGVGYYVEAVELQGDLFDDWL
jgi:hypothetical protein